MNAQALYLNGPAILYSPPAQARHGTRHPHVWIWKRNMTPSKPTLPSNHAFVVQFRTRPCGAPSWGGHVEHLASYQVARFHSLDALLAFMTRVLMEVEAQAHRVADTEETGGRAQRGSSCASSRATLEGHDR